MHRRCVLALEALLVLEVLLVLLLLPFLREHMALLFLHFLQLLLLLLLGQVEVEVLVLVVALRLLDHMKTKGLAELGHSKMQEAAAHVDDTRFSKSHQLRLMGHQR